MIFKTIGKIMGYGDFGGEEAFRAVLEELLSAKEKVARLEFQLEQKQGRISDLVQENEAAINSAASPASLSKQKMFDQGTKLWAAANAVKEFSDTAEFLKLREVIHETANEFDEIPF